MSRYERPNIARMEGYVWGEQPSDARTIKLNTNENPYPASPKVQDAIGTLDVAALRRYPEPTARPLRQQLAGLHGLTEDEVVVTNGGDEALRLALTTFLEPKAVFGMAEPSYSLYPVLADIHDSPVVRVPLNDDWSLPEDFAGTLNGAGAQLTCVVNPHAPSGRLLDVETLSALATDLDGVLLIDEAYADFIDPAAGYASAGLIARHENVLILRTFSKGYSLAGLRLGYLLGPAALIQPIIWKTRDSYNIDHVSQTIGAAAIADQDYARGTWQKVRDERARVSAVLRQFGLPCPPSDANFVLADFSSSALDARATYESLKQSGVLVRYFDTPRLRDRLRISIGTKAENDRLLELLSDMASATDRA